MRVTFEMIRQLANHFPEVEDGTSYGTPALKVKKKLMARLKEDGDSVVFAVGLDERELLMVSKPSVFYITDHYRGYPYILLRMSAASKRDAATIVEMAWRRVAPERVVAAFDSKSPSR